MCAPTLAADVPEQEHSCFRIRVRWKIVQLVTISSKVWSATEFNNAVYKAIRKAFPSPARGVRSPAAVMSLSDYVGSLQQHPTTKSSHHLAELIQAWSGSKRRLLRANVTACWKLKHRCLRPGKCVISFSCPSIGPQLASFPVNGTLLYDSPM